MSRIGDLLDHLLGLGIPVAGISTTAGQDPPAGLEISFTPPVTQEQIDQANQIKETWDYRPRRSLTRQQIAQAIAALTTAQQNTLLRHLLAILIRDRRAETLKALAAVGIPLAVDEVDPNPPAI